MSNFTSLEVSKRLAEAGFKVRGDTVHWEPGDTFKSPGEHIWRYRSDTLLDWLVGKDYQVAVGKSYDKKRYTAFYTNEVGEKNTRRELSDTIADALAEAVMKVLEVSK